MTIPVPENITADEVRTINALAVALLNLMPPGGMHVLLVSLALHHAGYTSHARPIAALIATGLLELRNPGTVVPGPQWEDALADYRRHIANHPEERLPHAAIELQGHTIRILALYLGKTL